MHAYQTEAEAVMHANPAVDATFTMSGNSAFLPANQAFLLAFLDDPDKRKPIETVTEQLMGGLNARIPGTLSFLQPNPVLQISTGAAATSQGQFSYAISGVDPDEVYEYAGQIDGQDAGISRLSVRQLGSF